LKKDEEIRTGKSKVQSFSHAAGGTCQPPELAGRNFGSPLQSLSLMAALSINAIAENASRLGARLQESLSEHTRDLNLSRGTSSEFFETNEERLKNIHYQLDSNSDREKLDAMKRLIAVWTLYHLSNSFAQRVQDDI
jgi:hypothetical protein